MVFQIPYYAFDENTTAVIRWIMKHTCWEVTNVASSLVFGWSVSVFSNCEAKPVKKSTSTILVVSPPPRYTLAFKLARIVLQ